MGVELYACSETRNFLRLKIPYPPTGEIEKFNLQQKYGALNTVEGMKKCELWDDYLCYDYEKHNTYWMRNYVKVSF